MPPEMMVERSRTTKPARGPKDVDIGCGFQDRADDFPTGTVLPSWLVALAVLIGVAVAIVITVTDLWIFLPRLPRLNQIGAPPAWAGFLGALYGGIDEELLLRLGVFSIVAWLLWRIDPRQDGPTALVLWETNVVVAVLFGLGHLPATTQVLPLTPLVVSRALVLNGLGSLAFGYQYWRHGLEAAMITHFSTDIVADILANIL